MTINQSDFGWLHDKCKGVLSADARRYTPIKSKAKAFGDNPLSLFLSAFICVHRRMTAWFVFSADARRYTPIKSKAKAFGVTP
jgi:hypothetical protein